MKLERIVTFDPAYDKRDPDPKKNHGIGCVSLRMAVKGPRGAISFTLFTSWNLKHVEEEFDKKQEHTRFACHPLPADLGYHSPKPMYDDQHYVGQVVFHHDKPKVNAGTKEHPLMLPPITYDGKPVKCDLISGDKCYYDGSGLAADEVYQLLVTKGDKAVWEFLEKRYTETFGKVKK